MNEIVRWKIIDDVELMEPMGFERIWGTIHGGFSLAIQGIDIGYCPKRELFPGEIWCEDILYLLEQLGKATIAVCKGEKYQIQLLTENLLKLELEPDREVRLTTRRVDTWGTSGRASIPYKEWVNEVLENMETFLANIYERNSALLEAIRFVEFKAIAEELRRLAMEEGYF